MKILFAFLSACLCVCALAAAPTTKPVITNIAAPGATRWAWPWAGLTGVNESQAKPDLAQWRAFTTAVRDNKPLFREWSGRNYYWWDANTSGILLDAEGFTSSDKFTLAQKIEFMTTVTRSVRAVAPKLSIGWYDDQSILFVGRTRYPWSAELLEEAIAQRNASRKLHALCDYIVIGTYFGGDALTSPAKWTDACQLFADNARLYRLIYPDAKLAWITMGYANVGWSRPQRPDESEGDYHRALSPSAAQIAELRETVAPYVDAWFVWCGEQDSPGEETMRMVEGLQGRP